MIVYFSFGVSFGVSRAYNKDDEMTNKFIVLALLYCFTIFIGFSLEKDKRSLNFTP